MTIGRLARRFRKHAESEESHQPKVLVLTPVKDGADCVQGYLRRAIDLSFPHELISFGFLESDSQDSSYERLRAVLPFFDGAFRRARLWKRDFGFQVPPGVHRGAPEIQAARRKVLARSRNQLLFRALDDEDWVLWLDIDVIEYPPDLIERLLATGGRVVQPHCVLDYGGPTFDQNGWRDHGRYHLDALRDEGAMVELDAVGGTVLLVDADLHRDGLIFPPVPYGRTNPRARPDVEEIETEGLGLMARDMGEICWGLPHLEVLHRRA
jgi:hypothetical protein